MSHLRDGDDCRHPAHVRITLREPQKPYAEYCPTLWVWALWKARGGVFLAYCLDLEDVVSTIVLWRRHGTVVGAHGEVPPDA